MHKAPNATIKTAPAAMSLAEVSAVEWALIILCIAAVLGMELMNSAIERAVDKPDT
ncbi:diacylglycerol kinase, partial [Gemmiger formicilis]|nr:diacylglycerol kinase [Gemmiger formicilis]